MTLSTTTNRVSFSGNGSTTAFSFPYRFHSTADLKVVLRTSAGVETTKTLTTHYSVSGTTTNGVYASGGTVTMVTAPASGETLTIICDAAATQGLDIVDNGALPAEEVEKALDRVTMLLQRQKNRMDRAVRLTDGYTATFDPQLPAVLTAGKSIRVNDAGDGLDLGATEDEIEAAQGYAEDAADSATAAATSASAASNSATAAASSASAASTSATNAATSATNAATSATAAATAKTAAETAETNAETAETNAEAAQAAAETAKTAAETAETNAETAATNAANSATAAATSATNASNSATAAATSETNAANSATSAATSETNAAASASTAAAAAGSATIASKTGNYTITSSDQMILGSASGGAFNLTLPSASANPGKILRLKKTDSSANAITVLRAGSDTIDAAGTSTTLSTQGECIELVSDGTSAWNITNRTYPTTWTAYTPSWSGGSPAIGNGTITGFWRRNGADMEIMIAINSGGTTTYGSGDYSFGIPSGYTIDTAQLPDGASNTDADCLQGSAHARVPGTFVGYVGTPVKSTTTAVKVGANNGGRWGSTSPVTWSGAGNTISLNVKVPIVGWN